MATVHQALLQNSVASPQLHSRLGPGEAGLDGGPAGVDS